MLAETLSRLHGPSIIRNESNGYHIYLASPECIKTDGRKEIQSKHLTVNASKYKQLPEWLATHKNQKDKDPDFSAICHKTNTKYRVSDLMNERIFPPLDKRGIPNAGTSVISTAVDRQKSLTQDSKGNWVPCDPGKVTSILDLPPRHPAVEYLKERGYDLKGLHAQFNCSYCTEEFPENSDKGIFYKRLPLNFRDTPQGRIIFYAYINGVQVGWQARIIDRIVGYTKEYWHPYSNTWVPAEVKNPTTGKWAAIPGIEIHSAGYDILWKPSKYKTAFGMARNEALMGVDAAVHWNKALNFNKPTALLVEGPLDAGRIGLGGIAMLGKYLSDKQADILVKKFRRLVMVMDNDQAGEEAKRRIKFVLSDRLVDISFIDVPPQYKDIGEMPAMAALNLIYKHIL